ncbi:hypothetical protein [Streptomyces sp. NPDC006193]|uniref:hypothetical protein n=1 Tax=Streptomyces sp. NPDC006193 TaxID=3155717 RepID=UPI0033A2794F
MTATGGLPYEECRRQGRRTAPRDAAAPWPGYALPPFRPGPGEARGGPVARHAARSGRRRRRRSGRRTADGAAMSGVLTALCVAALLAAVALAAVRTRC